MPVEIITRNEEPQSEIKPANLSHEIREIISNKPGWLVRNGLLLFFLILCILAGFSFLIRYPDVITATGKLVSVNAPKEVKTKTGGKLVKLFAKEGMPVKKGDILGFMESNANPDEILSVSNIIDSLQQVIQQGQTDQLQSFNLPIHSRLGEVQQAYQSFIQAFTIFKQYAGSGFYIKKYDMLTKDLQFIEQQRSNLVQQKVLQTEDLNLSQQTFSANKTLSEQKVISAFEYRNEKSKLIGKKLSIPQTEAAIISNETGKQEKLKEIMQLENDIAQQKVIFSEALNTFKSILDEWKLKYIITSPADGVISFAGIIRDNQQLKSDLTFCFVDPQDTRYFAEVQIPQPNSGKAKPGQQVMIHLPSFPSQEFGEIKGRLDYIYSVSTDSGFNARVSLPDGLITSYKKNLQFKEGLIISAEIVTENLKLSDRIFNGIRNVLKK